MKRILCLALCLLLLCGCTAPAPETAPASETAAATTTEAAAPAFDGEEYTLEPEPGCNQVTFYWSDPTADYARCDMWIWYPNADGHGYLFHPCAYGVKCVLNVPQEIEEVGFIVRTHCSDPGGASWGEATKDVEEDRFAPITGPDTEIYLRAGDSTQYFSKDGGVTLEQTKKLSMAAIVGLREIRYTLSPATRLTSLDQIRVLDGDTPLTVESLSSLDNEVITGVITLARELDLTKTYTLEIEGFEPLPAVPTQVFDTPEFVAQYTYDGDDLGATLTEGGTLFKLWAPTAGRVQLQLFEAGNDCDPFRTLDLERGEQGVWSVLADCGPGTYYTYLVTTALGTQEAVDPYARAVGVNGERGMVVDLAATDPQGFRDEPFDPGLTRYDQAVIWEIHVRDFSNAISGSRYPGKYLGFTETGLTNAAGQPVGLDYLAQLGVTHVQVQPIYDYATVDESSDAPQFNWGYDPKNYNAPEGSYSTDPYHGEVRIHELKQMVQALHRRGIGVVMDVVYNHTYALDSNLNRVVPYYYYRFTPTGAASNGSGCGNETASDRVMFRKYMVDSVVYWAKEYRLDGFRFDLMALHDVDTMQAVEAAVHAVNPQALLYGEGWTGGTTPLNVNLQANQQNIGKVTASEGAIGAVGVFNDATRDGLKGSVFDAKDRGYLNGKANNGTAGKVIFGLEGGTDRTLTGWSVEEGMVLNYMACHDNQTIRDKLEVSNPEADQAQRLAMNRLGFAALMLGKGIPFFLAGEEMYRTKGGDSNSYASSDAVNNLDWEALVPGSDEMALHDYYRDLIALRRSHPFLWQARLECQILDGAVIEIRYLDGDALVGYALLNPGEEPLSVTLPEGSWTQLLLGADTQPAPGRSGTLELPAGSALLVAGE